MFTFSRCHQEWMLLDSHTAHYLLHLCLIVETIDQVIEYIRHDDGYVYQVTLVDFYPGILKYGQFGGSS